MNKKLLIAIGSALVCASILAFVCTGVFGMGLEDYQTAESKTIPEVAERLGIPVEELLYVSPEFKRVLAAQAYEAGYEKQRNGLYKKIESG